MPVFEFDPVKDAINLRKHELSLAQAMELDWSTVVIVPDERFSYGEPRFRAYGILKDHLGMAVFTPRPDRLRIISFRRANRTENRRYGKDEQAQRLARSE